MKNWEITVTEEENNIRLDKCLASNFTDISRSHFAFLIKEGKVKINDKVVKISKEKVLTGDVIFAEGSHKAIGPIPICDIELEIVYEDDDLLVIDKPYDLVVHPVGKTKDSVIGALLNRDIELSKVDVERPGVCASA